MLSPLEIKHTAFATEPICLNFIILLIIVFHEAILDQRTMLILQHQHTLYGQKRREEEGKFKLAKFRSSKITK
jgi:hypothetical protein